MKPEVQQLRSSHLGAGLNEEELGAIGAIARTRTLRKGNLLFVEGDPASGFFVLLSGKLRIYKATAAGREYTIHQIRPGQMFAEVAIFHGGRYPANCIALEDSTVAFFPKDRFVGLIKKSPQISLKIIGSLAAFLRDYNQQVENLSLKEVPSRLATHLIAEAGRAGSNVILLDYTKTELARRLGTISETLSRSLRKLKDLGIIEVEHNKITILDLGRLSRISEEGK